MTTQRRPPVELLAQLEADALRPLSAARARRELARDPGTEAARAALAATRAELAAQPVPEPPADFAARSAAALAQLPPPMAAARRTAGRVVAALAAAAVVAGAVALGVGWLDYTEPTGDPPVPARLALTRDGLAGAVGAGLAGRDLGPLTEPGRLAACQRAAGLPAWQPLGGRQVVFDGRAGVLLVLPTELVGRFRLVVVDPACGTAAATSGDGPVLGEVTAGR